MVSWFTQISCSILLPRMLFWRELVNYGQGLIEGGRDTKERRQAVFFTETLLGMNQIHSTTYRRRECTMRANGSLVRTQSAGSTWAGHKKRITILADRFHAILFWLSASWLHWKGGKHQRKQDFVPKDSHATTGNENRVEAWQVQHDKNKQASNRLRKETFSQLISVCKEYHRMQYLKIKEEWPRFKTGYIRSEDNSRSESAIAGLKKKTGEFNTLSEESMKTPKLGKIELFELGDSARLAPNTDQKDCCIALAECVWDLRKNRNARRRKNSALHGDKHLSRVSGGTALFQSDR